MKTGDMARFKFELVRLSYTVFFLLGSNVFFNNKLTKNIFKIWFFRSMNGLRALTIQTLSWSLKSFITSNNVDLEFK